MWSLQAIVRKYTWVHLFLGILGTSLFVVGSALMLFESLKTYAVYCYLAASSGMLIGRIGSAIVEYEMRKQHSRHEATSEQHAQG